MDSISIEYKGLGSDNFAEKGKLLRIGLFFTVSVLLLWNLVNIPEEFARATVYSFFTIVFLLFLLYDKALKKAEYIETISEEPKEYRPPIFNKLNFKWVFGIFFVLSIILTINIARTGLYLVDAPLFQSSDFLIQNTFYKAFLSFVVGVVENSFFFGAIMPSIAVTIAAKTNMIIGVPSGVVLSSGIFTLYHFLVYGFTNIVATQTVFLFGIIFAVITYLFRSLTPADLLHGFNNAAIVIFRKVSISPGAIFGF